MSKEEQGTPKKKNAGKSRYAPIIGIAIISLLLCGLFFPLLITGIAQATMPYQANGEIAQLGGRSVGSYLIDNNFTLPIFFHARNDSASGVDPDITLAEAHSQIPRISDATGIPPDSLTDIVNGNKEGTFWIFGSPYVNVLRLNLILIRDYPSIYANYT
ncbi:MAG: potassium-transporting ATPase subunit C [Nitrososphaerales archaeon]